MFLHLGVGTTRAINKCIAAIQALELRKFKQNARKMFDSFGRKIQRTIPLTLQIHILYIMSFTKPDSFFYRRNFD